MIVQRLFLLLLVFISLGTAVEPDWQEFKQEALEVLVDLVKLDTSQPAGNEILAARYLQKRLNADGIDSEIFESELGRASIVARLQGNGTKKPLLLLGHLDVVAVEAAEWSFDAFGGAIKDNNPVRTWSR